MNITQIEEIVQKLALDIIALEVNKDEFIYQLMAAYGHRKTTIGRIKSGERNLAKVEGEVRAKRHIYFKKSQNDCVLTDIDNMKKETSVARDKIRFVIATDFNQFVALDTRTHDTLDIEFTELGKNFDFFLPWAGMEKAVYQGENPADVKAAEKMAKLFDLIKADNFNEENKNDTNALHNLNVFLTRLLFCFFAEDTGIFKQNQFSGELESHTKVDGSDVDSYLNRLFEVLNTSKETRGDLPDYLANFEYVNGGLFANTILSPRFSTKSRKMLIECGSELDWSDINPDIFGSMIQAVVHPDQRGGMGMHYTSVTNIMKVIEPLFLDELYAEFENIEDNIDAKLKPSRLRKLHDRIAEIKLFDPACGSGNFLIIGFKELRKFEMEIIKRLQELDENDSQDDLFGDVGLDSSFSRIKLSQFYGIELDDFAHEVAILSLWLAEHQMNVEFKAEFGECEPALPLKQSGNIHSGNSALMDWEQVVPSCDGIVYILGNPPYLGSRRQSTDQKDDLKKVFHKEYKSLDYIAIWFKKGADFIKARNAKVSFVSTNSIFQGEQVALLWPRVLTQDIEIEFAHKDFKWQNSAKNNAAVIVAIIGISHKAKINNKKIFLGRYSQTVTNITPYLTEGNTHYVTSRQKPISNIPEMNFGNMPADGGKLLLNANESKDLILQEPQIEKFIKPLISAREFLNGKERFCIWLEDASPQEIQQLPILSKRVNELRIIRENSSRPKLADIPHLFAQITQPKDTDFILIPRHSSENRDYIPIGYFNKDNVAHDSCLIIGNAPLELFAILNSRMHMVWVEAIAGRIKTDLRYSKDMVYNNFPIPIYSDFDKVELQELAIEVLSVRENYSDKTLAQIYKPEDMPEDLKQAHIKLNKKVESIYRTKACTSDVERLKVLVDLHAKMTGDQNA
jgi:hypothetical protein